MGLEAGEVCPEPSGEAQQGSGRGAQNRGQVLGSTGHCQTDTGPVHRPPQRGECENEAGLPGKGDWMRWPWGPGLVEPV